MRIFNEAICSLLHAVLGIVPADPERDLAPIHQIDKAIGKYEANLIVFHGTHVCIKKKNKKCSKKNVRRDAIEKSVALAIREYILKDDVIEWIADMVMDYQSKQKDNPEIELLHTQLADVKLSIRNILKAIEAGIITDTTKDRLQELEAQQADISAKISAAEYNIVDVSREYVVAWLQSFRSGDIEDIEYMNNLFSTFVSAVYIYDDKRVKVVFSIGGTETKSIDIALLDGQDEDLAQGSFKDCSGVPEKSTRKRAFFNEVAPEGADEGMKTLR